MKTMRDRRGAGDHELAELLERHSGFLGALVARVEALAKRFAPPEVLYTGRVLIPASGSKELAFPIPAQGVAAEGGNFPAVVAAGPAQAVAPVVGVGVIYLQPGQGKAGPLAGNTITVYGTPGDTVGLAVYSGQIPPDFGIVTVTASVTTTSSAAAAPVRIAAANADTAVLAANPARKGGFIWNEAGGTTVNILLGNGVASATVYTLQVAPGQALDLSGLPVFTGQIRAWWPAAPSGNLVVTELT